MLLAPPLLLATLIGLPLLLAAPRASAEPMNLGDERPRWVAVRFEISPQDAPGRLDGRWTDPVPAWLEPAGPDRVQVTVPAPLVERYLFGDVETEPDSFDDFVWTFDTRTGHVLSATLHGVFRRPLRMGLFHFTAGIQVDVALTTQHSGGFQEPHKVLGELVHDYCDAADPDCRLVPPAPYDPGTGAVNAVGPFSARYGPVRRDSFCPFGEAIFLESGEPVRPVAPRLPAVAAGPEIPTPAAN